ncbi:hypothetical protein Tco_0369889 [Tanacetum coccineum]
MIEGHITEKQQWKMFSAEISAQFQNNLAGKFLSEVELKGLMIILDNSDCGETYTSKYKDACELLDSGFSRGGDMNRLCVAEKNVMGTWQFCPLKLYSVVAWEVPKALTSYIGEPAARWNVGLCTESHTQDSLLRRMRYKIAAKILLHELNIHSQKMFDLAYKFETENDEHSRISIIVNAIKNRVERDPDKNVVENEEGDAVKNIK